MTTATATAVAPPTWRTVVGIFKLRIGVLIMLTALAGLAFSPGPWPELWQVALMALCVLAASAAAGAFNQYVEADSDRLMKRTSRRAFATGALKAGPFWMGVIVAMLAVAVGLTWFFINPVAALFLFLGAFTYAVIYTVILKRRTWWNIVFGGAAGSFAVLTGAAAADPSIGVLPTLLALVLFLWTPPHFWSLAIATHDDYAAAGIPMLPVMVGVQRAARVVHGNAIALVLVSLLPGWFGASAWYMAAAALGGAWFVYRTHCLVRNPTRSMAMQAFFASMIQLSVLIVGVVLNAAL